MKDYLAKAMKDPDRWLDSDMSRDEWLLMARYYAAWAVFLTTLAIIVGIVVL